MSRQPTQNDCQESQEEILNATEPATEPDQARPKSLLDSVEEAAQQFDGPDEPAVSQPRESTFQDEVLTRLRALESLQELSQIQIDQEEKIRGLQTALTLSHQDQLRYQNQFESKEAERLKQEEELDSLRQQLDESHRNQMKVQSENRNLTSQLEQLRSELESIRKNHEITQANPEPGQITETDTNREVETMADADQTGVAWEQQKMELMKKYGLESEPGQEDTALEFKSAPELDDDFEIKGLSVSEIEEPKGPIPTSARDSVENEICEEVANDNFAIAGLNVSAIEERAIDPEQPDPIEEALNANFEEQKKNEIELALERARISRQRRELEEKIISLQMDMSESQKSKSPKKRNLLSRMTQFLKRDEKQAAESRIENMVKLVDSIKERKNRQHVPQYSDPRDHPFQDFRTTTPHATEEVTENDSNDTADLIADDEQTVPVDCAAPAPGVEEKLVDKNVDQESNEPTVEPTVEPGKIELDANSTSSDSTNTAVNESGKEADAEESQTGDPNKPVGAKKARKPQRRKNRKKNRRK